MADELDVLVLGGGMRGLAAGLRLMRERPEARIRVVEAAPRPGGAAATQRSNGFLCELGPFGFGAAELASVLGLLESPPPVLAALPTASTGHLVGSDGAQVIELAELPVCFRTGAEELPQACRRQLGDRLLLGRAVTEIAPTEVGFAVTVGGEVPAVLRAAELVVALPFASAAAMLGGLDPAIADVGARMGQQRGAFVFLGGLAAELPQLTGYGWLPADGFAADIAEAIVCTQVFAGRALPGRVLVRCEITGPQAELPESELIAMATDALCRWSGCPGAFGFTKVHRFVGEVRDAAWAECRARLAGFAARGARIGLAPEVLR